MTEQQQTDKSYGKLAEAKTDIPVESARVEYKAPKLTRHGKVRDLTNIIIQPTPSTDGVFPISDFS